MGFGRYLIKAASTSALVRGIRVIESLELCGFQNRSPKTLNYTRDGVFPSHGVAEIKWTKTVRKLNISVLNKMPRDYTAPASCSL
jgi:hypothetical protein